MDSTPVEQLRAIITNPPANGIVGMVDDVLKVCQEHALQIDWNAKECHVRSADNDEGVVIENPLRKSVFRTLLARIAVLGNEAGNSVSPYGGTSSFPSLSDSTKSFQVTFVNTPDEQSLKLASVARGVEGQMPHVKDSRSR